MRSIQQVVHTNYYCTLLHYVTKQSFNLIIEGHGCSRESERSCGHNEPAILNLQSRVELLQVAQFLQQQMTALLDCLQRQFRVEKMKRPAIRL